MDFIIWIQKDKDIFDEDCLTVSKVYHNGKIEIVKDFKGEEAEKILKLLLEGENNETK